MPRTVTTATTLKAGANVSQPCYLLQIDWIGITTRMCTHSTITWNGQTWVGAGLTVSFDESGRPSSVILADPDASYRTLALGSGLSDRRVQLWKAYIGALATSDPVALFDGFADGFDNFQGRTTFALDYAQTSRQFTPRERIGPNSGVNFMGAPETKINWAGQIIELQAR